MKLEVGKAYKKRNGEKAVIASKDESPSFCFQSEKGHWFNKYGISCVNEDHDLISEWVDEPKYKAGDRVEIELSEYSADMLNLGRDFKVELNPKKIKSHTPAPEFNWSTVKAGMAFNFPKGVVWYVGEDLKQKGCAIFAEDKEWFNFDSYHKSILTRAPEHDIEATK